MWSTRRKQKIPSDVVIGEVTETVAVVELIQETETVVSQDVSDDIDFRTEAASMVEFDLSRETVIRADDEVAATKKSAVITTSDFATIAARGKQHSISR